MKLNLQSLYLPVLEEQLALLTCREQTNMKEQPLKPKNEHDRAANLNINEQLLNLDMNMIELHKLEHKKSASET